MVNYQFNEFIGLAPAEVASQYHRASKKSMSFIRPSLKRLVEETQKELNVKLTGFSYIREYNTSCHATKVAEKKTDKRYFICLMFGPSLYLEDFDPQNGADDSVYVIGGMSTSKVIISAGDLRAVFRFIPQEDYDLSQRRCSISKEKFYAGVRRYMEAQKKQKGV